MKPLNIKKVVNFVKLGYKIFEQWCIIEKRKNNSHKMYILTVLLHKKNEMDTGGRQTRWVPFHAVASKKFEVRKRLEMHITHHNQLKFLKLGLLKKVTIYKKGKKRAPKSDLVTAPNIHTPSHLGPHPTKLALVQELKLHTIYFSTGSKRCTTFLRKLILLKSFNLVKREIIAQFSSYFKKNLPTVQFQRTESYHMIQTLGGQPVW